MTSKTALWIASITLLCPYPAWAKDPVVQPIPVDAERASFTQGVPTLDLTGDHGAVQVTPLPMDHGRLAFRVAVHNSGPAPANIDIGSFDIHAGPQRLVAYSRQQLEQQAKSRALWGTIGVAALGALGVAASLDGDDDHHYRHSYWDDDLSTGETLAAVSAAGAVVGAVAIQGAKNERLGAIRATAMQLNTVYPDNSYAGRIVLTKLASHRLPLRVDMVVNWNGEQYPFAFQIAKAGTLPPIAVAAASPVTLPVANR